MTVPPAEVASPPPGGSLLQPVAAGVLAALVGFASSFAIVVAGLKGVGASPVEAASGLFALALAMAVLNIGFALRTRLPITLAWSTPGAALLATGGVPAGGFSVACGAFLIAAGLVVVAGLWRSFGRIVSLIPMNLAGAMLAGVLLELCLAPIRAVGAMPHLALPIIIAWALTLRFARLYAVPVAVLVTAVLVVLATPVPPAALAHVWPQPLLVVPGFSLGATVGIALPLFLVTMATQNVPGLAVMAANGYRPAVGPIFLVTGLSSGVTALFGGHTVNLAAITAALCAGPESHPDPKQRWIASLACGFGYLPLALGAGFAAAFISASPPLLIQAVAGLALFGSLGGALSAALASEEDRLPAVLTFVTTASGVAFLGIGAAFWGLVAGGALMVVLRYGQR